MKKIVFTFVSAKGYQIDFVRYFSDSDLVRSMLEELEVLSVYVNTKEDFDSNTLSKIIVEY